MCTPSDLRAPVKWSTLPLYVDLEQEYNVQFTPANLNHTLSFPIFYELLPRGTLRIVCDLINIEEPDVPIDPMEASIIFIQSKNTLQMCCIVTYTLNLTFSLPIMHYYVSTTEQKLDVLCIRYLKILLYFYNYYRSCINAQ